MEQRRQQAGPRRRPGRDPGRSVRAFSRSRPTAGTSIWSTCTTRLIQASSDDRPTSRTVGWASPPTRPAAWPPWAGTAASCSTTSLRSTGTSPIPSPGPAPSRAGTQPACLGGGDPGRDPLDTDLPVAPARAGGPALAVPRGGPHSPGRVAVPRATMRPTGTSIRTSTPAAASARNLARDLRGLGEHEAARRAEEELDIRFVSSERGSETH